MGAQIIDLAEARARRERSRAVSVPEDFAPCSAPGTAIGERFLFWRGASGERYVHTVYTLADCPDLRSGNFLIVRRDAQGARTVMAVGRLDATVPAMTLAQLRALAADLVSNEIHVHLLAETDRQSRLIEVDLRAGHLGGQQTAAPLRH